MRFVELMQVFMLNEIDIGVLFFILYDVSIVPKNCIVKYKKNTSLSVIWNCNRFFFMPHDVPTTVEDTHCQLHS